MKKILALLLALCMCVAVLVACDTDDAETEAQTKAESKEESETYEDDGFDYGDGDYENEGDGDGEGGGTASVGEITISSIAEWNALAAAGDVDKADFLNKTVKLTADLDFGLATTPRLFRTFAGTFDGGNHTVKGYSTDAMSILANTLDGATVKNVTFDGFTINSSVDGATSQSVVAAKAITKDVTVENITVNNCTIITNKVTNGNKGIGFIIGEVDNVNVAAKGITVTASKVKEQSAQTNPIVGGVIGYMNAPGRSTFEEIKINMDVNMYRGDIGGVVGEFSGIGYLLMNKLKVEGEFVTYNSGEVSGSIGGIIASNYGDGAAHTGDTLIRNAYVDVNMCSGLKYGCVGGVTGYWGKSKSLQTDLTVENCYITGEIYFTKNTLGENIGGVIGSFGSYDDELNINNVIVEVAFNQASKAYISGVTAGTPDYTKTSTIPLRILYGFLTPNGGKANISGCYTTVQYEADGTTSLALPAGLTAVATSKTTAMVGLDAKGFVSEIKAPAAS